MSLFEAQEREFQARHIGPNENETAQMLKSVGAASLDELMERTVPSGIRMQDDLDLPRRWVSLSICITSKKYP
jgi:glycine dehydrogenase